MATMRVAGEHFFHTPEAVREHVENALNVADDLNLTDEDRACLLPVIVNLLAAKQTTFEQVSPLGILGGGIG